MKSNTDPLLRQCVCSPLRRLTRRITAIYDHHLAVDDITISQYSLLSWIARQGPIPNLRLATEMGMERSTLSRNLKPLMLAGWVEITDLPASERLDKRSFALVLTVAGKAKRAAAYPHWQAAQDEINSLLGDQTQKSLIGIIEDAYKKLQVEETPAS